MTVNLLRCYICEHWYRPSAHAGHCPFCGSMPMKVSARTTKYYRLEAMRLIEVVRGIPRTSISFHSSI